MKTVKLLIFGLVVILATLCLSGCSLCFHSYAPAACTVAKTCTKCAQTKGEALGHLWLEATCEEPATCSVCGATNGAKLEHDWSEPTCETPSTCKACGTTTGSPTGHTMRKATCTVPEKCVTCGMVKSPALGHFSSGEATCTTKESCKRCGTVIQSALGHKWQEATCTSPKTCLRCDLTEGKALWHNYSGLRCKRCQETNPNFLSFSQLGETIYSKTIGIPYSAIVVGGISWEVKGTTLTIQIDCEKTFDILGKNSNDRCEFVWKLYDKKGYIVDSDNARTEDLVKGDRSIVEFKIYNVDVTQTYKLKLYDYEALN